MSDKITFKGLPIKGIGEFIDNHGNSIKGVTLRCNGQDAKEIGLFESGVIHNKITPFNSDWLATLKNLFAFKELDLGENVSPLKIACEKTQSTENSK